MTDEIILRSKYVPAHNPCKTIGEYVLKLLNQLEDDFICLIDAKTDERLTIGSLKSKANNIAVALINRGVTKADRIAFYGNSTIEHIVLRFVTLFLGITFIPLSPTFGKYEVKEECEFARASIICSSEQDLHKFSGILDKPNNNIKLVVVFDGQHNSYVTFEQLLNEGKDKSLDQIPFFDVDPEKDMAFLIHTSGSTGRPKCAMIPHRFFLSYAAQMIAFGYSPKDSVISMQFPIGHISGTALISLYIISGSTIILINDSNEEFLMKSIEKYRIKFLPVFPNIGRKFIENDIADKYDLSSIERVITGGAAFPGNIAKSLIQKFGVKFDEYYGMTECLMATAPPDSDEFIPGNMGTVGPGMELKIIDLRTGKSLGPNIDGELCFRGERLFAGYLTGETVSHEAFDSEGWYRTGDIGHYDDMERVFITDRLKEVVRIAVDNHYINISPVEIEQFLLTHKSIAEVAVVGVNNTRGTHWPRAYVVLKDGKSVTEKDIQKFVSDTLAYTKQLKGGVVFVDHIQRTSIGKVDRKFYRNLIKDEVIDY